MTNTWIWAAVVIVLSLGSVARADVIPPDYRPPPPPECSPGAQPHAVRGRGHGGWGGCAATTCATDADCPGTTGPCREAGLCVGQVIVESGVPVEPGSERPSYRIASSSCGSEQGCPGGYECEVATRCVGRVVYTPPPAPAPAPPAPPPRAPGTSAEPSGGMCTIGVGRSSASAVWIGVALAALWLARSRR